MPGRSSPSTQMRQEVVFDVPFGPQASMASNIAGVRMAGHFPLSTKFPGLVPMGTPAANKGEPIGAGDKAAVSGRRGNRKTGISATKDENTLLKLLTAN